MKKILINYSEIGLKGKNKSFFLNKLKGNIVKSCSKEKIELVSIKKEEQSFLCEINSSKKEIINCFKDILGIKYFMFVEEIKTSQTQISQNSKFSESLKIVSKKNSLKVSEGLKIISKKNYLKDEKILFEKIDEILKDYKKQNIKIIYPKTKRSDKTFPLNSPQINNKIREIAKKYEIEVDYKNQKNIIFIKININSIFISFEKYLGPAGLPVDSAGRVLVLFSGGIDSPVASWNLMRRGCHCDFLHLHNLKSNEEVLNSKIIKIIKKLNKFQFKSTLYTLPYETFEFEIIGKVFPRYELVVFKYYLLKLSESIAKKYDYLAIANGDNLAQVASQTLENLNIVNYNINLPIFRPLLTFEKEEIIDIARKIDTFELSIQNYKDCCSLVAKNPMTKAKQDKFLKSIENINIDNLIEKSLKKISIYKI